jgi:hypothetical protein
MTSLHRYLSTTFLGISLLAIVSQASAQITINELVEDEQDFETTDVTPDTREFVELYNAGPTAVDISGWTIGTYDLDLGIQFTSDLLPNGSSIPAGGYFVIGGSSVPNVNYSPVATDLFDNTNIIYELRNPGGTLIDALGVETFRGVELEFATQEQLDQMNFGETAGTSARSGWWGQLESNNAHPSNASYPNLPMSLGRYKDGRDTNVNGRDFGMLPATPGAKNDLALVAKHDVTNVDAVAVGSVLRDDYYASFKLPRVITPGTVDTYNPNVIPASPQGGRAIIAWDETGGGNAVYSDEYTNKFEIYAFVDPRPFNNTTADSTRSEATVYGIGTTDPLFGTPNSADLLTGQPGTGGNILSSANGSTGFGWLIQRRTSNTAGVQSSAAVLQLIDFNDGGDGVLADAPDWEVIETIDLTGQSAAWHRLSIDYDPTTGEVTALYGNQQIEFTTQSNLIGNFYVGYREQLPGTGSPDARPPTYDLYVAPTPVAGDYNGDGSVTSADYTTWKNAFGTNVAPGTGADGNGNGVVDAADYTFWRDRLTGSGASAVAVPEPTAILLTACGLALLPSRRRR